ncbi:hypothetical protein NDU88_001122 [Pleurodeles waltl]|uniref:Uncharacterized protein n=1 Tax=Pleurodeles waltl TaxID=8319 RepID=A0AAV7SYP5_PLEWA|nr:hypothetical protein NDU88_001122 [Pleurodeles waltl]
MSAIVGKSLFRVEGITCKLVFQQQTHLADMMEIGPRIFREREQYRKCVCFIIIEAWWKVSIEIGVGPDRRAQEGSGSIWAPLEQNIRPSTHKGKKGKGSTIKTEGRYHVKREEHHNSVEPEHTF